MDVRDAGGLVVWYQPLRWYTLKRYNNRTHRELMVIDGTTGFIGGAGISSAWDTGVKGGMTYGTTDDFGWKGVDKRVHVHDLHATILYLMGIDHTKLTYRYSGRDFRLTDVAGNVIHDIIA